VSVVVALYNKRATIERALHSIFIQEPRELEVIVIDDGSTDGSADLVDTMGGHDVIVVSQVNSGPGAARNAGVRIARAPYIAFLDADDEWRPEYLTTALARLAAAPEALAYVCGYDSGEFRADRPNKIKQLGKAGGVEQPPYAALGPALKMHIDAMHSSCVVVRRKAFDDAGGFFTEDSCRYGEDSWVWARLLLAGKIVWDPAERVVFHLEDSDLGYATTRRTQPRPISLYPDRLANGLPTAAMAAIRRLSTTYAALDYRMLVASGSWEPAAALRKRHRLDGPLGWANEQFQKRRSRLKRSGA
jgi:glycosyltransferase involved in cell wall biosynthesis